MALNLLNRVLNEPNNHERRILATEDMLEDDEPAVSSAQTSFINQLHGDLEAKVIRVHKNTDQKLLIVTQDKALLCLKKNLARLGKREWIAPLSTVLTILIALITSDFKFALGLGPAEWRAMFIVSGFIATGWLSFCIHKALNAKNFHEVVRDVVLELGAHRRQVHEEAI